MVIGEGGAVCGHGIGDLALLQVPGKELIVGGGREDVVISDSRDISCWASGGGGVGDPCLTLCSRRGRRIRSWLFS